jgi:hemolysin III
MSSSVLISDLLSGDESNLEAAPPARSVAAAAAPVRPALVYHPVAGTVYDGPLVDRAAEEWCNTLTHGIGAVLSVAGAFVLLGSLGAKHDATTFVACSVYLATLLGVYVCSSMSHYIEHPTWKQTWRVFDQAFIYLLIVGSYTPFAAMYLHGGALSVLFWTMWGAAVLGFLSKTVLRHRVDAIATGAYVALAWMPVLAAYKGVSVLPGSALALIGLGGAFYMLGLVFFMRDHRVRYAHAAWHVLVMAGSACHFYAVVYCVATLG